MAKSFLTEAIPKKPEPGAKAVDIAASIVDRIFIYFFAIILLFCLYAIYDALMVYREAEVPVEVRKYAAKDDQNVTSKVDFAALKDINNEIVAWIQLDDTDVDFPITRADNNSFYLSHSYTLDYSLAGSIFLDYRNSGDFTDDYNIAYGHNMNGEMMFGGLYKLGDKAYFDSHETGRLLTPDNAYDLKIIAALKTDRADSKVYEIKHLRQDQNQAILDYLSSHSLQSRISGEDYHKQIIALSTCFDKDGGRVVIFATFGKIEEPEEEIETPIEEEVEAPVEQPESV